MMPKAALRSVKLCACLWQFLSHLIRHEFLPGPGHRPNKIIALAVIPRPGAADPDSRHRVDGIHDEIKRAEN